MFDALTTAYPVTAREESLGDLAAVPEAVREVLAAMGGTTLAEGFYRFHTVESAAASDAACAELLPGYAGRFTAFAFDWLGRELAVDLADGTVVMVDAATDELLRSDLAPAAWHDVLAEEDVLGHERYLEWRANNPSVGAIGFDQSVTHRHPLVLGGSDEIGNLELGDRQVNFSIAAQIAVQIRDLPPGASVDIQLG